MPKLNMKCPHCKKEISEVNAYFEFYQKIDLEKGKVLDHEIIFEELADAECPECKKSIKDSLSDTDWETIMSAA